MPTEYAIYLRKSRADIEAESRGEGETLARHEKTLIDLANKRNLTITSIFREIVSGENIAARPQVQQLLAEVNDGKYEGVLVMEVERLARGDTIDQGVVAQAFKSSDTKIITPVKVYDPNNEFDEEYFEFSLFMSRREYKTIKRRMNAGRLAAVKEGNYIGTNPPYGYKKTNPQPKIHTLEIVPEEAEIIKFIFKSYMNGKGARAIATELNNMGAKPAKLDMWASISVKKILQNPVYAGKLTWKTKGCEDEIYQGLHEPIISYDEFLAVQDNHASRQMPKVKDNVEFKNYYHKLLYCSNCGRAMLRRNITSRDYAHMLCRSAECRGKMVSTRIEEVDEVVKSMLTEYLNKLQGKDLANTSEKPIEVTIDKEKIIKTELSKLKTQQNRLYDLLEQGLYDTAVYVERSKLLADKIAECEKHLKELEKIERTEKIPDEEMTVRIMHVLDNFDTEQSAEYKNAMLRSVIKKIKYTKTDRGCKNRVSKGVSLEIEFL